MGIFAIYMKREKHHNDDLKLPQVSMDVVKPNLSEVEPAA